MNSVIQWISMSMVTLTSGAVVLFIIEGIGISEYSDSIIAFGVIYIIFFVIGVWLGILQKISVNAHYLRKMLTDIACAPDNDEKT